MGKEKTLDWESGILNFPFRLYEQLTVESRWHNISFLVVVLTDLWWLPGALC